MIDRARESRNPKKVIRVTLMESYGEIGRVPVNLRKMNFAFTKISYIAMIEVNKKMLYKFGPV